LSFPLLLVYSREGRERERERSVFVMLVIGLLAASEWFVIYWVSDKLSLKQAGSSRGLSVRASLPCLVSKVNYDCATSETFYFISLFALSLRMTLRDSVSIPSVKEGHFSKSKPIVCCKSILSLYQKKYSKIGLKQLQSRERKNEQTTKHKTVIGFAWILSHSIHFKCIFWRSESNLLLFHFLSQECSLPHWEEYRVKHKQLL